MNNKIIRHCEPPGYYIKEELDARSWSQTDLAYVLDMQLSQLNAILSGKNKITADMAVQLSEAFNMPAEFFTNLQKQYDLSYAVPADPAIKKRAEWQTIFPLREMIKRKWLEEVDVSLLDAQMLRFFDVNELNKVPCLGGITVGHAAKKTAYDTCTPEQVAWLYRVRQIANNIEAPLYDKQNLKVAINELSGLRSDPDDTPLAFEILLKVGVRLLMVESLPGAKIDGVCTWINDQPVIALSNRFDRLDNFWFVLRHELEHVLREHGLKDGKVFIDNDETLKADVSNKNEKQANAAASDFCVSQKKLQSLILRKSTFVSEKDILAFSRRLGIHPSIVVGQYQYLTQRWHVFRKYLTKNVCGVREVIISSLGDNDFIDGWDKTTNINL